MSLCLPPERTGTDLKSIKKISDHSYAVHFALILVGKDREKDREPTYQYRSRIPFVEAPEGYRGYLIPAQVRWL
jgi:hypothetical protein